MNPREIRLAIQLYNAARSNGASHNNAINLVGSAYQESSFNPRLTGSDGGTSFGLMQVGSGMWRQMRAAGVTNDPVAQMNFYIQAMQRNAPDTWAAMQNAQSPQQAFQALRSNPNWRMGTAGLSGRFNYYSQLAQQLGRFDPTPPVHEVNSPSVTPTAIPFRPPIASVLGSRDVPTFDPATGQYSWPGQSPSPTPDPSAAPRYEIPLSQPPAFPDNIPPAIPAYDIPLSQPPAMPSNIPDYAPQTFSPENGIDLGHAIPPSLDQNYLTPGSSIPMNYGADFMSPSDQFGYFPPASMPTNDEAMSPAETGFQSPWSNLQPSEAQNIPTNESMSPDLTGFQPWSVPANDFQPSSPGSITDNPFYDPAWSSAPDQTPGSITDNPFADPSWTTPVNQSSPGTVTDNPFADPSWLPQEESQPQFTSNPFDHTGAQFQLPSQDSVHTVEGTIVADNGMYYRFDPVTGSYQPTGIMAGSAPDTGAWNNLGYGAGSPFGAGAAGMGGAGFGGYGGLGGSGAPSMGHVGGMVDTSTPQGLSHGGVDPTDHSSGGFGSGGPTQSAMTAFKLDAAGNNLYIKSVDRHGR